MNSPDGVTSTFAPQVEVLPEYALVTHEGGMYDNPRAQQFLQELADICRERNISRVLLDERRLQYTVGEFTDLVSIADSMVENLLVFRFNRMACVTTIEQLKIIEDFATVANNRGLNFGAFSDIHEAEAWITAD